MRVLPVEENARDESATSGGEWRRVLPVEESARDESATGGGECWGRECY